MANEEQKPDRTRTLLLSIRQALIIVLGAIEDYLSMERSIVPRRKRKAVGPAPFLFFDRSMEKL